MLSALLLVLAGLVLLFFGGEALVRGSASLALRLKMPPLIVGLTVVAFGTSAPELVVSVKAALADLGDIAVGNVVGSNIANIAVILGLCAVIRPLSVHADILRIDAPVMIAVSVLGIALMADGALGRVEGMLLVAGLVAYTGWRIIETRRIKPDAGGHVEGVDDSARPLAHPALDAVAIVGGLVGLVYGGSFLVDGASTMARAIGVPEVVIGLTIVAIGTSMPELAASVLATIRGQTDIAVGNIVGSNIFNLMGILGGAAIVKPMTMPGISWGDQALMFLTALVLLFFLKSGFRLCRKEGITLLLVYVAYAAALSMR